MLKPIQKILVANRGEIAIRIFQTLHKMGIGSVAIYADADADAAHVHAARESFRLEGKTIVDTYLNTAQIISLALQAGVDAIHPGYGFLSESDIFSSAVRRAGLIFIGPGDEAIRLMGNKVEARKLAESLGVPVIRGITGTDDDLIQQAAETGFPVLVKAAAGGGGKGMRIVYEAAGLPAVIAAARREAQNYFGDGEVYIEKYLDNPRHIEVQLMADHHGTVVCLFERECSIQRRYQKIIEEAPSAAIDDQLRQQIMDAARRIAQHIAYVNAGTIEFLFSEGRFYFLEMNTRIQVEHPVTEMITGIDLVKEQIRVASGQPLSFRQEDLRISGHAIEARVYAEDPMKDFLPAPGEVVYYREPQRADIRIDAALRGPGFIRSDYDPMISKVIAYARTREAAREKLSAALTDYVIHGTKTNIPFLVDLLNTTEFMEGMTDTGFCSRYLGSRQHPSEEKNKDLAVVAAAFLFVGSRCAHHVGSRLGETAPAPARPNAGPWGEVGYWRVLMTPILQINGTNYPVHVLHKGNGTVVLESQGRPLYFKLMSLKNNELTLRSEEQMYAVYFSFDADGHVWLQVRGKVFVTRFAVQLNEKEVNKESHNVGIYGETTIFAPMHGKIVSLEVSAQEIVNKGDTLLVLESMKMENKVLAPGRGIVEAIMVSPGDHVGSDTALMILTGSEA